MANVRRRGWAGAMQGLGEAASSLGGLLMRNNLARQQYAEDLKQRQQDALSRLMLEKPDQADDIAALAQQHYGLDLSGFKPSDEALLQPMLGQIAGATDESKIPDMGSLISRLKVLSETRPGLDPTRVPGAQPETGAAMTRGPLQAPGLPSTPLGDAAEGAQTPVLPSRSVTPAANPVLDRFYQAAQARKGQLQQQRDIAVQQAGALKQAEAGGTAQGQIDVQKRELPFLVQKDQETARAAALGTGLGANDPSVAALQRTNYDAATPGVARRAGAEEGAREAAKIHAQGGNGADFQGDMETTIAGHHYVNMDTFRGQDRVNVTRKIREWNAAHPESPVRMVDKQIAYEVAEVDKAKLNLREMWGAISSKLPKDAAGRLLGGALGNQWKAYLQTDADLKAFEVFQTAAIQVLRAVAGARGLRVNYPEVQMSIKRDIPQIGDTLEVTLRRLNNIGKLLDNIENVNLVMDRRSLLPSGYTKGTAPIEELLPGDLKPLPAHGGR